MVEEDKKGLDTNKPLTPPGADKPTQPSDVTERTTPIGFTVTTPEMEKYREMLSKNPSSRVFAALSELYRKGGMLDEAIQLCLTGLNYHPNYMSGRVALGRAYFDKGMYKEAKEELDKVVSTTPDNLIANKVLGEIHLLEKDLEKAKECFERVHKISPDDEEIKEKLKIVESGGYDIPSPEEEEPVEGEAMEAVEDDSVIEDAEILEEAEESEELIEDEIPDILSDVEEEEASDKDIFDEDLSLSEEEDIVESLEEIEETFTDKELEEPDVLEAGVEIEEEAQIEEAQELDYKEGDTDKFEDEMGILKETFDSDLDLEEITEEIVDSTGISETELQESEADIYAEEEEEDLERERVNISTETIADIYVKQGYFDKALHIYEELNTAYPGRQNLKEKLEYVEKKIAEKKGAVEDSKETEDKTFAETVFDKDTIQKNIEKLGRWLMNIREYKKI